MDNTQLINTILLSTVSLLLITTAILYRHLQSPATTDHKVPAHERAKHELAHGKEYQLGKAEQSLLTMAENGSQRIYIVLSLQPKIKTPQGLFLRKVNNALAQLQSKHAMLNCIAVVDAKGVYSFKVDYNHLIPVTVVSHGSWMDVWRADQTVGLKGDQLFKVFVVELELGQYDVILAGEHASCDGISFSNLANQFICAMNGTLAEAVPSPKASKEKQAPDSATTKFPSLSLPNAMEAQALQTMGGYLGLARNLIAMALQMMLGKLKPFGTWFRVPVQDSSIPAHQLASTCTTTARFIELTEQETAKLIQACREHNTSVTSIVAVILAYAIIKASTPKQETPNSLSLQEDALINMFCGADTRRHYKEVLKNSSLSYHVAGVLPYFFRPTSLISMFASIAEGAKDRAKIWQVAREYKAHVQESVDRNDPITIASFVGAALGAPSSHEHSPSATLSSWGVLPYPLPKEGDEKKNVQLLRVRNVMNMNFVRSVSAFAFTAHGRLQVTLMAPAPAIAGKTLDDIEKVVKVELVDIVKAV